MLFSLARPALFHSQRNNQVDPASTCNVTAMVNALLCTGIPIDVPDGVQPEDHLAHILEGEATRAFVRRYYPTLSGRKAREIHAVLSWATNEFLIARRVTVFSTTVDLREILFRVVHHRAASCVAGQFTRDGHVVALVGFETDQADADQARSPAGIDLGSVRKILVNDSWGDWHEGYRGASSGYEVAFTMAEFQGLAREVGSRTKWAHLFDRDGHF